MNVLAKLEYPYISGKHGPAQVLDIVENNERYGFLPAARYILGRVGDVFSKYGVILCRKTFHFGHALFHPRCKRGKFSNAAETVSGLSIIMTVCRIL